MQRRKKKIIPVLFCTGVILLVLGVLPFFFKGGANVVSGPVMAITLNESDFPRDDKKELASFATAQLSAAEAAGYNTVFIEAGADSAVLKALCKAANGTGVQVFASVPANISEEEISAYKSVRAAGLAVQCTGSEPQEYLELFIALNTDAALYIQCDGAGALPPVLALFTSEFSGVFLPAGEEVATAGVPVFYTQGQMESAAFAAAVYTDVQLGKIGGFLSAVSALENNSAVTSVYNETPAPYALPAFYMPASLAVSYPAGGSMATYDASIAFTGTGVPGQEIYIDGELVEDRGEDGSFVAPVSLAIGVNKFTITQGEQTCEVTVTRRKVSSSGASTLPANITPLEVGDTVKITPYLGSLLSDEDDDESIVFSAAQGSVFKIKEVVKTVRSGRYTYAYKTAGGQFILASAVEETESLPAGFASAAIALGENGTETLTLTGAAPLAVAQREGEKLIIDIYGMGAGELGENLGELSGELIRNVVLTETETGVRVEIVFEKENAICGWKIEAQDGALAITCNPAPVLSADPLRPLAGVRIMLDPGHGGNDTGALGLGGGIGGASEKDLNFALAQAIRQRLEQLGASVEMTRNGDEYFSLQERLEMANEAMPHFFLAVHHNSTALLRGTQANNAVEAYSWERAGAAFAQELTQQISTATSRDAKDPQNYRFYVTRTTVCPAVLFEFGYVVNTQQYAHCYSPEGILQAAAGTANAVLECLQGEG